MSFLQVLLLLLLGAYGALFALENPGPSSFPLPFGRGGVSVPAGVAGLLWFAAGLVYAALLFLPVILRQLRLRRRAARSRNEAEARLASTLQARLANPAGTPTQVPQAGAVTLGDAGATHGG